MKFKLLSIYYLVLMLVSYSCEKIIHLFNLLMSVLMLKKLLLPIQVFIFMIPGSKKPDMLKELSLIKNGEPRLPPYYLISFT